MYVPPVSYNGAHQVDSRLRARHLTDSDGDGALLDSNHAILTHSMGAKLTYVGYG
jgi:hypothetical protein